MSKLFKNTTVTKVVKFTVGAVTIGGAIYALNRFLSGDDVTSELEDMLDTVKDTVEE